MTALEQALAGLKPSRQLDRDRFLFLAGRAAAEAERRPSRFTRWAWPASTFLSAGTALVLLTLLLARSAAPPSRTASDLPSTVVGPIDSPATRAVVASRNDDSANNRAATKEASEPSLADVVDLDEGAPFNSLRLRYDRLAAKGNAVAKPAPVRRGPLASFPIEAPRTQHDLLREFLKADRLAQTSPENQAG